MTARATDCVRLCGEIRDIGTLLGFVRWWEDSGRKLPSELGIDREHRSRIVYARRDGMVARLQVDEIAIETGQFDHLQHALEVIANALDCRGGEPPRAEVAT